MNQFFYKKRHGPPWERRRAPGCRCEQAALVLQGLRLGLLWVKQKKKKPLCMGCRGVTGWAVCWEHPAACGASRASHRGKAAGAGCAAMAGPPRGRRVSRSESDTLCLTAPLRLGRASSSACLCLCSASPELSKALVVVVGTSLGHP